MTSGFVMRGCSYSVCSICKSRDSFMLQQHTYRKHFKDLQPVGSPAFLGFVDWQREVNIPGILREEQHQEDSPADRKKLFTLGLPVSHMVLFENKRTKNCKSVTHHLPSASDCDPRGSEPINQLNCQRVSKSGAITGKSPLSLWSERRGSAAEA